MIHLTNSNAVLK